MDGWVDGKAVLTIAYSNQKHIWLYFWNNLDFSESTLSNIAENYCTQDHRLGNTGIKSDFKCVQYV